MTCQILGPFSQTDFQMMQDIKYKSIPFYSEDTPTYQSMLDKERNLLRELMGKVA